MKKWQIIVFFQGLIVLLFLNTSCSRQPAGGLLDEVKIKPATTLWYQHPAEKWENALPVGNGRLGAMVFGKVDSERVQFNEETYWSGGPYSQTVMAGYKMLPEIQSLIFRGEYVKAHKLFGRYLMGYPVEQQKYQSMGDLILNFNHGPEVENYRLELDLSEAIVNMTYQKDGINFKRQIFCSPVDQVIVIRLTADKPSSLSLVTNLRGCRNQAHSNYATEYFRMDGYGQNGLILRGKSADYLGIKGQIRYEAQLKAITEGGTLTVNDTDLVISGADSVTLFLAAATNFVNYKDVSGDPHQRVEAVLKKIEGKSYDDIKIDHLREHQRLFDRVAIDLGSTAESFLPTDERLKKFDGKNDPNLAALCFQFGRYLLISSSRQGTQPANLQGIWNQYMNPPWDSKYTTNINLEMNYWPAEVANLSECTEPLFRMIKELTDQGSEVAREHYGAKGWVFHQNTDQWRVAAPMDGPDWGTFTTGGAWLCTHLWEHYLFSGDVDFLKEVYPAMKGSVEFFLDFLKEHPKYGWLVTNPSTSPENFPDREGNGPFFDEVTGWMSPGTTICAGSIIDMEILSDLFSYVAKASEILDVDEVFREKILKAKKKLAPLQVGSNGQLQEWLEDWGQKEKSHRHISSLYGLFPGNQISLQRTPELANGARAVLEQRGLEGNGWSSAWKMACWARLLEAERAMDNFAYAIHNYTYDNLFSICAKALQVDGSLGVSAAIAEMLLQSQDDEIFVLPSIPMSWRKGEVKGLRARGGFEINLGWDEKQNIILDIKSSLSKTCRIRTPYPVKIKQIFPEVSITGEGDNQFSFEIELGESCRISLTRQNTL
ncbi:MAG TPA: glycoside hydrolase family 95 protein [Candidatus Saccharicenans sp.]|nr:glycoside hydrolase family 95 protein [Candidatus Saccharicenans sp.]